MANVTRVAESDPFALDCTHCVPAVSISFCCVGAALLCFLKTRFILVGRGGGTLSRVLWIQLFCRSALGTHSNIMALFFDAVCAAGSCFNLLLVVHANKCSLREAICEAT